MRDVDERQRIYLNIVDTGIHYESEEEFENSYYKYVYKQAFRQLNDIIIKNKQANNSYVRRTDARFSGQGTGSVYSYEKFSNIMTFMGKRGSGKTSVMMSFMGALKNYSGGIHVPDNKHAFFKFDDQDDILFTCLDCIDGSLLEHGEDIFKIVLAEMYQKFRDLEVKDRIIKDDDFDYRKRELLKELEDIYKTVCDIESMDKQQVLSGGSYMSSLQSLSSSQKVRKEFEKLVKKFTELIVYNHLGRQGVSRQHYVVITIDDIDLNVKNGFSMLEKIHRYFMVSNVIVLLSVAMEQILSLVFQSFYDVVPKVDEILREEKGRIRELSMDYLDKLMPVNYRIYLPELYEFYSTNDLFTRREDSGIKKAILGKIYRRIGICFDSEGKKRHFYEPKSMRNLTNFYLLLNSIDPLDLEKIYCSCTAAGQSNTEERRELARRWEANCQLLLGDLTNRLVIESIYSEKSAHKLFKSIVRENIHRVGVSINVFYSNLKKNGAEQDHKGVDDYTCSYGELIEIIYDLGHLENYRYKPLVYCFLAYLSYAYTREYIFERLAVEDGNGKRIVEKGNFKQLIGKNIVSKWAENMLPAIQIYKVVSNAERGTFILAENDKEYISQADFYEVVLAQVFNIKLEEKYLYNDDQKLYRYLTELINSIEALTLFFTNIKKSNKAESVMNAFKWGFQTERDKRNEKHLKVKGELAYVGDFNVLSFIINSMYASENLGEIEENLTEILMEEYLPLEHWNQNAQKREEFKSFFEKKSLKLRYEQWEETYGKLSLPFPVYWFDFTYNIMKRVRREMLRDNPVYMDAGETFIYIKKLFRYIANHLSMQDEFYGFTVNDSKTENSKKQYAFKLRERFEECPVVQFFLEDVTDDDKRKVYIAQAMSNMRAFSQEV